MITWRLLIGIALLAIAAFPVLLPLYEALSQFDGSFLSFASGRRLLLLARNTLLLAGGTLLLALPLSIGLAVLLLRTDLPFRHSFLFVIVLSIFVPLPVFVSSWQALLGTSDWLPFVVWQSRPGQPWAEGLLPSVWVHALVAIPWILLILGNALVRVDRSLEEAALLSGSALRVIWHVTLPCCRPAVFIAALWTAVQTVSDINVTDMFMLRTYAEEVYLVFNRYGSSAVPRAVFVSIPFTILFGMVLLLLALRYGGRYPPPIESSGPAATFSLGKYKWVAFILVSALILFLFGIPVSALGYQGGLHQAPAVWSGRFLIEQCLDAFLLNGPIYFYGLWWATEAAMLATLLAFLVCWSIRWSAKRERIWPLVMLTLVCAVWVIPAPVVGQGLHRLILHYLVYPYPDSWLASILYYEPSSAPLVWAYVIRIFPFCLAVQWPAFRAIPQPLCDAARLEGASNRQSMVYFFTPMTQSALIVSMLVGIALSLADIGTSKSAMTPGIETFTLLVFDRMHYGVKAEVSALCLVMIAFVTLIGLECVVRYRCFGTLKSRQTEVG